MLLLLMLLSHAGLLTTMHSQLQLVKVISFYQHSDVLTNILLLSGMGVPMHQGGKATLGKKPCQGVPKGKGALHLQLSSLVNLAFDAPAH